MSTSELDDIYNKQAAVRELRSLLHASPIDEMLMYTLWISFADGRLCEYYLK